MSFPSVFLCHDISCFEYINYPKFMSHMNKKIVTARLSWRWAWIEKERTDPQQRNGCSHTTLGISRQYNVYATNTLLLSLIHFTFSDITVAFRFLLFSTNETTPMHHSQLHHHYNCKTKAGPSANAFYDTLSKPVYLHGQETHQCSPLVVDHVPQYWPAKQDMPTTAIVAQLSGDNQLLCDWTGGLFHRMEYLIL